MRWLAALLFLSSFALGTNAVIKFSQHTHGNYYEDYPMTEEHVGKRTKRSAAIIPSILRAVGIASQCDPGWTGQFCENPMCNGSIVTPYIGSSNANYRLIDSLYLPSGCTGKYYVPVDGVSMGLGIQVNAAGMPWINLTDSNGNLVEGTIGASQDTGYARYPPTLPPGAYSLTIDNGGIPTTDCIVTIGIFTNLAVTSGFALNPQTDDRPFEESGIDGTPMYYITHPVNLTTPGQVRALTIRNTKSTTPVYRSQLTSRYGCAYEWYAGQFSCSATQVYVAHVDGIDQFGYPWRRTVQFSCLPSLTTAAPPTTPAPITACMNNGTLVYAGTPQAMCFCPELFSGSQCENPSCMNGGYLAPSGVECVCPDGFYGINCQSVNCDPNYGPYLSDAKTLIVVVRIVQSMNQYSAAIIGAVTSEMKNSDYANYVLVRYYDDTYLSKSYEGSQADAFVADINRIANLTVPGNCSDTVFDAIYSIFTDLEVYEKSPILHFTDAIASDTTGWRLVTEANSRRNLPIYSFFFPQSGCNFDPLAEGYRAIQNAAMFSGGLTFLDANNPSTNQLSQQITMIMRATTKNMNLVYANDLDQCVPNVQRSFAIDSSADTVIIIATGPNLLFSLWDPDNEQKNFNPISDDGMNYIWEVANTKVGQYVFSIAAANQQDPCSIRVVAKSQYDFFFATTFATWWDAIDSVPVVGTPYHLVAQLNGLYNATRDPFRLFAELTITTNRNLAYNQPGKPMYYSNGVYRDGCGYHLYFGVADFCEFDNQPFYATVFADDNNGFTIQRTQISFCSITNTTTNPPGSCQNGGVIDPSNNSTCICQVGFIGEFCQSIVCQSGGTPAGTFCVCPAGSFGTFCELYTCPSPNLTPPGPAQFEGKAMVFVVAARPTMQDFWTQLAANVAEFTRDCQHHSAKWIKSWVLVTINGDTDDLIVNSRDPKDFVTAVQTVAGNLSAYSSTKDDNCTVKIMSGLLLGTYFAEPNSNIYVFTDASGYDNFTVFPQLFDKVSEYEITVNLIQTSPSICTIDGALPNYIQQLAWMTSGFYYISPAIDQMLLYITAQYKTGVIGAVASDDCSNNNPAIGYIAVDSQTQAITLAAIGANISNVEAFLPDGSSALAAYYQIVLVQQSNLWLVQYMAACEFGKGWSSYTTSCLSFGHDTLDWFNASRQCHQNAGGFLVDINNDDKDDFITRQTGGAENWIGLFRNGNSWYWDVPDGNVAHPLDTSYQYWCTDGVWPTNDTTQDCVYMTKTGCWKNTNCNTKMLYTCQKHRYGQGYYPQDPSANAIMPGRWQFKVSSKTGSCYAQIKAQSDIQIFQGFVTDPHDDFPHMFANSDSANNYVAIAPTGISAFQGDGIYQSMEGNINYALIGYNNSLLNALTVANRPFCGYSYISQAFSCPVPIPYTTFFIKYSGIDQHGYAFDRYIDSKCNKWVTQCSNDGFLYNGACVCQPGWAGDRCKTPICQNGGVPDGDSCTCGGAYSGKFCELPHCEPPVPSSFATTGRTLAIMLETSYGMGSTIWLMQRNLKAALDSIQTDPTTRRWFTEFILYPFDSTSDMSAWYPIKVSSNSDDIVDALKTIPVATCPGNGTCDSFCPRPYLKVLENVLSMPEFTYPDSLVMIITQSTPEDAAQSDRLTQLLQETRAQINYILPAIDSPCGEGWGTNGVKAMYKTLQYSDGNIFVMSPTDVCQNFIAQYIPTLYKSAAIESQQYRPCMDNDLLFQVEHEMYEFTIDYYMPATTPPFTLTLTDPANDTISLPPSLIISDSNYLGVIRVNDTGATRAGTYRLSIKGGQKTDYCSINIKGRSSIELYPGFVSSNDGYNGAITDGAHYSPVLLETNALVVHAAGLDDANGMLSYAQFIDLNIYGLIHTTMMKRRNAECYYEWYGNLPIDWQYESLLVIIYGRDGRGANFHRNYYVTGVSNRPAVPPPPITQNCRDRLQTSVQQDFIFMIDSSLKNNQMTFNQIKAFASNAMLPYKFSPNFTQTAALTVADQAYGGFSFLAATSWNLWNNYVNNLTYSGQPGQNTTSGFNYIIDNYTSSNQGYRSGSNVRHSIIYVTNTNPTDADPQKVPYTLRRSGQFGIGVIAFNTPVTDQLKAIAGSDKCIYGATSLNDLNNFGVNFVQQFSCYNIPICGM